MATVPILDCSALAQTSDETGAPPGPDSGYAYQMNGVRIVAALLAVFAVCASCDRPGSTVPTGRPVERLTLGTSEIVLSSLIWVAQERGHFAEQGLDIRFKLYESGHLAVKDLLAGRVNLATATEFVAVRAFMKRPNLRIISILDRAEDQDLIARKDHGIAELSDLRGKRIGLAKGSSSEYYLHLLLILQDIPLKDVQLVDLLPSEQLKAMRNGDVDAVMTWEPFTAMVKKDVGINAVSWPGQSGLKDYWLLLGTNEFIKKHPRAIGLFLAALSSAEAFIKNNDEEARSIMSEKLADKFEDSHWEHHRFRLALDRPLLLKMEAELAWMKSTRRAKPFTMPDLRESIYSDGLKSMKPEKVNLLY